jgi:hypothetical protein
MYGAMRAAGSGKVEDADAEGTHRTRPKGILRNQSDPVREEQEEERQPTTEQVVIHEPVQTIDDDMADDAELPQTADMGDTSDFYMEVNAAEADSEMVTMMDVLQCLGVEPEDANTFYVKALKAAPHSWRFTGVVPLAISHPEERTST